MMYNERKIKTDCKMQTLWKHNENVDKQVMAGRCNENMRLLWKEILCP